MTQKYKIKHIRFRVFTNNSPIKNNIIAHAVQGDTEILNKIEIMGALNLYLDFINLFLYILRILGRRK